MACQDYKNMTFCCDIAQSSTATGRLGTCSTGQLFCFLLPGLLYLFCIDSAELPARPWAWLHGLGLRSRVKLASAAFVGSLARSLPLLIDRAQRTLPDAAILTSTCGYMPQLSNLSSVFGAGAFDESNEQLHFEHFAHHSGTRLAREMSGTWAAMHAERPGATNGALAAPPAAIGVDVATGRVHSKFQRRVLITAEREAAWYAVVDASMRRLSARDQRRLAWLSEDVFSQSFVTALPTPECALPNAEFAEAMTIAYLGLPRSPRARRSPVGPSAVER